MEKREQLYAGKAKSKSFLDGWLHLLQGKVIFCHVCVGILVLNKGWGQPAMFTQEITMLGRIEIYGG